MTGLFLLLFVVFMLAIYFLPSVLAYTRKKDNFIAIFALNAFLGWSVVGWVVSLVWALSKDQQQAPQTIIVHQGDKNS